MIHTQARYTVEEASKILRTPRSKLFQRISRGELSVVKDGRNTFITPEEIDRYSKCNQPLVSEPAETY